MAKRVIYIHNRSIWCVVSWLGSVGCYLTIKLPGWTGDKMVEEVGTEASSFFPSVRFPSHLTSDSDLSSYLDVLLCDPGQVPFPFWASVLVSWLQLCEPVAWRKGEVAKPGELRWGWGGVSMGQERGECGRRRGMNK